MATLTVLPTTVPAATSGTNYSVTFGATGGSGSYSFSTPNTTQLSARGLTLNNNILSGTPNATGNLNFTINAVDNNNSALTGSRAYTLNVSSPATIRVTTTSLSAGTVGVPYSAQLAAVGGVPPYVWSLGTNNSGFSTFLPPGLTLNSNGAISGTPTTPGQNTFSVKVTDQSNNTTTVPITLPINIAGQTQNPVNTVPTTTTTFSWWWILIGIGGLLILLLIIGAIIYAVRRPTTIPQTFPTQIPAGSPSFVEYYEPSRPPCGPSSSSGSLYGNVYTPSNYITGVPVPDGRGGYTVPVQPVSPPVIQPVSQPAFPVTQYAPRASFIPASTRFSPQPVPTIIF